MLPDAPRHAGVTYAAAFATFPMSFRGVIARQIFMRVLRMTTAIPKIYVRSCMIDVGSGVDVDALATPRPATYCPSGPPSGGSEICVSAPVVASISSIAPENNDPSMGSLVR